MGTWWDTFKSSWAGDWHGIKRHPGSFALQFVLSVINAHAIIFTATTLMFGFMFSTIVWGLAYTGGDVSGLVVWMVSVGEIVFSKLDNATPGSGFMLFMYFGQIAWLVTAPIAYTRLFRRWKLYKAVNGEWQNCRCETVYAGISPGH